jgi:hypothetical protein
LALYALIAYKVMKWALFAIDYQVVTMLARKRDRFLAPPKDYVVDGVFKRRQFHHSASIAPMMG